MFIDLVECNFDPALGSDKVADDDKKVDFSTRAGAIVKRKAGTVYSKCYCARCNEEKRIERGKDTPRIRLIRITHDFDRKNTQVRIVQSS